jgi:hypothetical protein
VLIFPELIRFDDYPYGELIDQVRVYCEARRIEVVDLLPLLSAHRDRDLWVHESDHHPNPAAHELAARALLGTLD